MEINLQKHILSIIVACQQPNQDKHIGKSVPKGIETENDCNLN